MEFASNVPVSRPRDTKRKATWDLGGMSWSVDYGMFYEPLDELVPIRKPPSRIGEG